MVAKRQWKNVSIFNMGESWPARGREKVTGTCVDLNMAESRPAGGGEKVTGECVERNMAESRPAGGGEKVLNGRMCRS